MPEQYASADRLSPLVGRPIFPEDTSSDAAIEGTTSPGTAGTCRSQSPWQSRKSQPNKYKSLDGTSSPVLVSSYLTMADAEAGELVAALEAAEWLSTAVREAAQAQNEAYMYAAQAAKVNASKPAAIAEQCAAVATAFAPFRWRHGQLQVDGKLSNTLKPLAAFLHVNGHYAQAEPEPRDAALNAGGGLADWFCGTSGGRARAQGRPTSPPVGTVMGRYARWLGPLAPPMKTVRFAPTVVVVEGSEVEVVDEDDPDSGEIDPEIHPATTPATEAVIPLSTSSSSSATAMAATAMAATPVAATAMAATPVAATPVAATAPTPRPADDDTTPAAREMAQGAPSRAPPSALRSWNPFEAWSGLGAPAFGAWDRQLKVALKSFLHLHGAYDGAEPRTAHGLQGDEWDAEAVGALQRFLNAHAGERLGVSRRMGLFSVAVFGVSEADPTVAALQRFLNGQMA